MSFAFYSSPRRPPARTGAAFVLAVGRRVYVARSKDGPRRVALMDDGGASALGSLLDGNEVEILAWLPRGSGTRYRVRSTREGLEGWLGVANLRSARAAIPPAAPVLPIRPAQVAARPRAKQIEPPRRRAGQRAG